MLPQAVIQTALTLNDGSVLDDARAVNINGVVALLVEALKEERQARLEDQALLRKEQEARQELGDAWPHWSAGAGRRPDYDR